MGGRDEHVAQVSHGGALELTKRLERGDDIGFEPRRTETRQVDLVAQAASGRASEPADVELARPHGATLLPGWSRIDTPERGY